MKLTLVARGINEALFTLKEKFGLLSMLSTTDRVEAGKVKLLIYLAQYIISPKHVFLSETRDCSLTQFKEVRDCSPKWV